MTKKGRFIKRAGSQKRLFFIILGAIIIILASIAVGIFFLLNSSENKRPQKIVKPPAKEEVKKVDLKKEAIKLYNQGKFKNALPLLEKYLKNHPKDVEARTLLASSYWLKGQVEMAAKEYLKALNFKPNDSDLLYRLGILFRQLNQDDRAVDYLEKAVSARPEIPLYHAELAKTYTKKSLYDQSLAHWEKVLELTPEGEKYRAIIFAEIGNVYVLKGDVNKARESYQKGLAVEPENSYLKAQLEKTGS